MADIMFNLNGRQHDLSTDVVESRLAGIVPEVIREYAVRIGGTWYPVKQAFELAVGVPRTEFASHTARRHLTALELEVRRRIERLETDTPLKPMIQPPVRARREPSDSEWQTEANVQAAVVTALAAAGWRVLSVANTSTRERGVDIIASLPGQTVGIEVKGFPSRNYTDPHRVGEMKKSSPSTQAGHWFAQALLAAMRLRGREPAWRSVIALPDFRRYRDLHSEIADSLKAAQIELWWVGADGTVAFSSPSP